LTDAISYLNLGFLYEFNKHPDSGKNINKAIELYKKAIELGEPRAFGELGSLYEQLYEYEGYNGGDLIKAAELYEKGINAGDIGSIHKLACMYRSGTHSDGQDLEKAIELYEKAINEYGHKKSIHQLIHVYKYEHFERNTEKNIEKIIELYLKLVDLKDPYAPGCIEVIYKESNKANAKINEAYKKVIKIHEQHFDSGDYRAIVNISRLYTHYNDDDDKIIAEYIKSDKYAKMYEIVAGQNLTYILFEIEKPPKKLQKIYGNLEDICPYCHDNLIGTTSEIIILICGHMYHYNCYNDYNNYNRYNNRSNFCGVCGTYIRI